MRYVDLRFLPQKLRARVGAGAASSSTNPAQPLWKHLVEAAKERCPSQPPKLRSTPATRLEHVECPDYRRTIQETTVWLPKSDASEYVEWVLFADWVDTLTHPGWLRKEQADAEAEATYLREQAQRIKSAVCSVEALVAAESLQRAALVLQQALTVTSYTPRREHLLYLTEDRVRQMGWLLVHRKGESPVWQIEVPWEQDARPAAWMYIGSGLPALRGAKLWQDGTHRHREDGTAVPVLVDGRDQRPPLDSAAYVVAASALRPWTTRDEVEWRARHAPASDETVGDLL